MAETHSLQQQLQSQSSFYIPNKNRVHGTMAMSMPPSLSPPLPPPFPSLSPFIHNPPHPPQYHYHHLPPSFPSTLPHSSSYSSPPMLPKITLSPLSPSFDPYGSRKKNVEQENRGFWEEDDNDSYSLESGKMTNFTGSWNKLPLSTLKGREQVLITLNKRMEKYDKSISYHIISGLQEIKIQNNEEKIKKKDTIHFHQKWKSEFLNVKNEEFKLLLPKCFSFKKPHHYPTWFKNVDIIVWDLKNDEKRFRIEWKDNSMTWIDFEQVQIANNHETIFSPQLLSNLWNHLSETFSNWKNENTIHVISPEEA